MWVNRIALWAGTPGTPFSILKQRVAEARAAFANILHEKKKKYRDLLPSQNHASLGLISFKVSVKCS